MSSTFRMSPRDRWAARSVVLKKWLVTDCISAGEPVCSLEIDGTEVTLAARDLDPADSPAGVYWFYVREGHEVGAWGDLLEYTDHARAGAGKLMAGPLLRRRPQYPSIFLNYRRDDSDAYAGRLDEALTAKFGRDEVFMDEFSIRPGEVFSWTIQQAVVHAKVVVSLIGPKWWTLADRHGSPRIDGQRDFVRREIVAALDRGIPLIPTLLPGGVLDNDFFEEELDRLKDLQYHALTGAKHWKTDTETLFAAIENAMRV